MDGSVRPSTDGGDHQRADGGMLEADGPLDTEVGGEASAADGASVDAAALMDAAMPSAEAGQPDAPTDTLVDSPVSLPDTSVPPAGCAAGAIVFPLTTAELDAPFPLTLDTPRAVCVTYMGSVSGWNAMNTDAASTTVTGSTATVNPSLNQPGVAPGADGYIYWNFASIPSCLSCAVPTFTAYSLPAPQSGCAAGALVIPAANDGNPIVFNTTGAVCVTYNVNGTGGWRALNVQGRSITAVGGTTEKVPTAATSSSPLSEAGLYPGADGYIYWNFSAGAEAAAEMELE
jgi:hypothetical protein